jgi:ribosomal protein S18 acetylase RimI-like enzyme
MMSVALVPVGDDDAESLAELRVSAMRESLEALGRFDPVRARSRFLDRFDAGHTRAIVVEGERVGFVVVRPVVDHLLLDHLYVSPSAQSRGAGSQVLQLVFAEADAANKSLRVAALKGSRSNDFYVRHGFSQVEAAEWDNYYVRAPRGRRA